jgi:hypothetical protein
MEQLALKAHKAFREQQVRRALLVHKVFRVL